MNKSYKSFKEIDREAIEVREIIGKLSSFYGHTHYLKNYEPLSEHTIKTKEYFLRIIELNHLEMVIDRIISELDFNNTAIGDFIKKLFFNAIVFHDFGKTNPNFQVYINNGLFTIDNDVKIGKEHSFLSAYVFLNWFSQRVNSSKEFSNQEKYILLGYIFLFTTPIIKHHSGYIAKDYDFGEAKITSIHKFISQFGIKIPFNFIKNLIQNETRIWNVFENLDFFPLFALLKLNYSLLTSADYYATNEYMNDINYSTEEDFGLITENMKTRLFHYFENNNKTKYNGELLKNTENFLSKSLDELREKSNKNLNFLRQKLGAEVLVNINKDNRVFYIEAPTGGGKTNMSMIAVRRLLELHPEINKVFYVFPFTTLITQTAKVIKDTLGLGDSEIAQVHSKASFQSKNYGNEEDAKYGKEKRNEIDNLFVNYPFTLLTHIKFFDVLKSNKKAINYLLHRLANSIVIIDELQSYNPSEWDKVKFFISQYSELFNTRFILMSATLPKIDEIKLTDFQFISFKALIPKANQYLQNPNFAERVAIETELLDIENINLEELASILFEKSKEYAQSRKDKFNGNIYTIIEFIFKKSASEFYSIINEENDFFDEIFVLSGTIIEPRRKYIIEYLKDENNRNKKILLITTQVVEAGVDIDMDLGFKNQSLIDSDEQLSGRINRNVNKKDCRLWLFKYNEPNTIYGKDLRYKVSKTFSKNFTEEILTNKNFEKLYNKVFEEIDKLNDSVIEMGNFEEYLSNFKNIRFREIDEKFKLIDSDTTAIFVPIDIDITCYRTENNFSDNEVDFIRNYNCLEGTNGTHVSGEKVWNLYVLLVQNKEMNFSKKKMELMILNGIMSKFVFSIFIKKAKDLEQFCEYNENFADFKYFGYYKLRKENIGQNEVYDLISGLNEKFFDKSFNII